MFTTCSCQNCKKFIEFDDAYTGMTIKCPHCFEITKLFVAEAPLNSEPAVNLTEIERLRGRYKGILPKTAGDTIPSSHPASITSAAFGRKDIPEGDWIN